MSNYNNEKLIDLETKVFHLCSALVKAREYVAALHQNLSGAVKNDQTCVKADLDMIDAAIAKAKGE